MLITTIKTALILLVSIVKLAHAGNESSLLMHDTVVIQSAAKEHRANERMPHAVQNGAEEASTNLDHPPHSQGCNGSKILVPGNLNLVCSATWQLSGKCEGADMWNKWKIRGRTNPEDSFIRPFEETSIIVIGYELVKLLSEGTNITDDLKELNDKSSWFMIGSAIYAQPDAMLYLGPGESHISRMWPAGTGQLWPSKEKALPGKLQDMIDLHGVCWGGGNVDIFLTIYYIPQVN